MAFSMTWLEAGVESRRAEIRPWACWRYFRGELYRCLTARPMRCCGRTGRSGCWRRCRWSLSTAAGTGPATSLIVVPGSPGCLPGRRFPRSRSDRSRGFF